MPILKGSIRISNRIRKVKILIDSGAAISLISRDIADSLIRTGIQTKKEGENQSSKRGEDTYKRNTHTIY